MKRNALLAALASLLIARVAVAQETSVVQGLDPNGTTVEGPGYTIGEGTVLHPMVGAEAGVDSNLFHQSANTLVSPLLSVLAHLDIASAPKQRTQEGKPHVAHQAVDFRAGANLLYREYLSQSAAARAQRNLDVGAMAHLGVNPQGTFAAAVDDAFVRDTRPPNYEVNQNIGRDINRVRVSGAFAPGGGALQGVLRFQNVVDAFESSNRFASRLQNTIGLRLKWRFLPVTLFYIDGSYGFFGPLGNGMLGGTAYKVRSNPLRVVLGTDTAITQRTTVKAYAGYGKGFYASGPDFSGPLVGVDFGYRYSPLGRVTLGYRYGFEDSVNANFYSQHGLDLTVDQQLDRFLLRGKLEADFRAYHGIPAAFMGNSPVRNDLILWATVAASYHYRDWFAFVASYALTSVQTNFRYTFQGTPDNPSYVEHLVSAGVQASF